MFDTFFVSILVERGPFIQDGGGHAYGKTYISIDFGDPSDPFFRTDIDISAARLETLLGPSKEGRYGPYQMSLADQGVVVLPTVKSSDSREAYLLASNGAWIGTQFRVEGGRFRIAQITISELRRYPTDDRYRYRLNIPIGTLDRIESESDV